MCALVSEAECVPAAVPRNEREPFVPEVLKAYFYRVLFLVGSEVERSASNGRQRKQDSRRSPAKRVRWEEETQRNE